MHHRECGDVLHRGDETTMSWQGSRSGLRPRFLRLCLLLILIALGRTFVQAQQSDDSPAPRVAVIVQQMVVRNKERSQQLGPYTSRRHYHIDYRGFPHAAEADMVVDVTRDGRSSESFQIVSQSGSHLLIDHVFTKLLETEKNALAKQADNELSPANYDFTLVGQEQIEGRQAYILHVEPKVSQPLLYRGKIWVDALDCAVVKVEAQPAKNPSFWIRGTEIHHVYGKVGNFWLPRSNRSETKVRLGGTAVLTIDYGSYHFLSSTVSAQSE
jgi:hypothetical protein